MILLLAALPPVTTDAVRVPTHETYLLRDGGITRRAVPGLAAIASVKVEDGTVKLRTLDGAVPRGDAGWIEVWFVRDQERGVPDTVLVIGLGDVRPRPGVPARGE